MVNASKKAGKTTLLMNAARSLLLREKFLGRFGVDAADDERVAYLNLELSQALFVDEMKKMSLPDHAEERLEIYHAMEHGPVDFRNDQSVDWLISWLKDSGIQHLFVDPLSSIYVASDWGRDPNDAFNKWWLILEDIYRKTGLRSILIAHHTGLSAEAANRGRGAAALGDKPDVNMSYRYNVALDDSHTDKPKDRKRYLSAYGRGGVDFQDHEVTFDKSTNILKPTGSATTRKDSEIIEEAKRMHSELVKIYKDSGKELNKGEIFGVMGWELKGKGFDRDNKYYQHAIQSGWIIARKVGNALLHQPGTAPLSLRLVTP